MVNLYKLYQKFSKELESELESRELCAFCCKLDRNSIFLWNEINLNQEQVKKLENFVIERKSGKPLAYILGEWEFFSLPFKVNENVLIPRADTEVLVEEVIKNAKNGDKILDLCTGSGAIAISLAKNIDKAIVCGVDISHKALEIARENSKLNEVKVEFLQQDIFNDFEKCEKYDIIVSNPPYIPSKDIKMLDIDVKDYEPLLALDGDEAGLKFYEHICKNMKHLLVENGQIYFEYGINQHNLVVEILEKNGFVNIEIKKDLCGIYRMVKATKIGE